MFSQHCFPKMCRMVNCLDLHPHTCTSQTITVLTPSPDPTCKKSPASKVLASIFCMIHTATYLPHVSETMADRLLRYIMYAIHNTSILQGEIVSRRAVKRGCLMV